MQTKKIRCFCFPDDCLEVVFTYDGECGKYFGDYPDFEETPRLTQSGRPWVNAVQDACRYGVSRSRPTEDCMDCGSCIFFQKELPEDLIGVCDNENKKHETNPCSDTRKDSKQ